MIGNNSNQNQVIINAIKSLIQQGYNYEQIKSLMQQKGYPENIIDEVATSGTGITSINNYSRLGGFRYPIIMTITEFVILLTMKHYKCNEHF